MFTLGPLVEKRGNHQAKHEIVWLQQSGSSDNQILVQLIEHQFHRWMLSLFLGGQALNPDGHRNLVQL